MVDSPSLDTLLLVGQYPGRYRTADTLDKIKQEFFPPLMLKETFATRCTQLAQMDDKTEIENIINNFLIPSCLYFEVEFDLSDCPHLDGRIVFIITSADITVDEEQSSLPTSGKPPFKPIEHHASSLE